MATSVRSCLSYDLSNAILSPSKFVYFKEKLHCGHRRRHDVTFSRQSANTRVVITLFMTWRYPLNNSNVIGQTHVKCKPGRLDFVIV